MTASTGSDDGGYDAHFQAESGCDGDVRLYYESLTPDITGSGWFDQRLATLHEGIDIVSGRSFYTSPRQTDQTPSDIPARHPLRALAWVLSQAPTSSTVRVYCYMLTDPMAIDLLIHHGADKTIQIILHPDRKNHDRIKEFFSDHGRIAMRAFRDRLQVRTANTDLHRNTQMHDKSIITDNYCTFGSYNLSCPARYQSWESLYVADRDPYQAQRFDVHWNSLADHRSLQNVYPQPPARPPPDRGNITRVLIQANQHVLGITINSDAPIHQLRVDRATATLQAPKVADGSVEICLSFFKRGQCFSNCNRGASHRVLTDAERSSLLEYLGDQAGH